MTGGVRISLGSEIVPVLRNLAISIEAEDVEGDLVTHTGEVVDGLQEHLVAILKSADVVDCSLYGSGSKISNAAHEGIAACAVSKIVSWKLGDPSAPGTRRFHRGESVGPPSPF